MTTITGAQACHGRHDSASVAPFGRLLSAPGEVLKIIGLLRTIADNTAAMAEAVRVLPSIEREMAAVAEATAVLGPMDARMAAIESAMPVLVEVQKSLVRLPDTADHLDAGLTRLTELLDRLFVTLEELQASIEPLARLAQRFPGGGGNRT
jgi:hypothetical protein